MDENRTDATPVIANSRQSRCDRIDLPWVVGKLSDISMQTAADAPFVPIASLGRMFALR